MPARTGSLRVSRVPSQIVKGPLSLPVTNRVAGVETSCVPGALATVA